MKAIVQHGAGATPERVDGRISVADDADDCHCRNAAAFHPIEVFARNGLYERAQKPQIGAGRAEDMGARFRLEVLDRRPFVPWSKAESDEELESDLLGETFNNAIDIVQVHASLRSDKVVDLDESHRMPEVDAPLQKRTADQLR